MERTMGFGMGRASVEKISSQMANEVADRCDVIFLSCSLFVQPRNNILNVMYY